MAWITGVIHGAVQHSKLASYCRQHSQVQSLFFPPNSISSQASKSEGQSGVKWGDRFFTIDFLRHQRKLALLRVESSHGPVATLDRTWAWEPPTCPDSHLVSKSLAVLRTYSAGALVLKLEVGHRSWKQSEITSCFLKQQYHCETRECSTDIPVERRTASLRKLFSLRCFQPILLVTRDWWLVCFCKMRWRFK